jgi:hypothetical protein
VHTRESLLSVKPVLLSDALETTNPATDLFPADFVCVDEESIWGDVFHAAPAKSQARALRKLLREAPQ